MILQNAYFTNALVNLSGKPKGFYKIDLLQEHQNGDFKRFCTDKRSSLQETDQIFQLHTLTIDALSKVSVMS